MDLKTRSMPEHRTARAEMAGIAAKPSACDDAEALQSQCFAHRRHQAVQLQTRGVRMFRELRPEKRLSAQPRQVGGGHVKIRSNRIDQEKVLTDKPWDGVACPLR